MNHVTYRVMRESDYAGAIQLWQSSDGLKLRGVDSEEGIAKYLTRNPELSFVAESGGRIIGTVLAGHDGRRGYLQHLAVHESFRKQGIATRLVAFSIETLAKNGIAKSHVLVLGDNELAKHFWESSGWKDRQDLKIFSYISADDAEA